MDQKLRHALENLREETDSLWTPHAVDAVTLPESELAFQQDFVSPGVPGVFVGAVSHWPARDKWGPDLGYLVDVVGDKAVTVNFTPHGLGDHVNDGWFVMPEERKLRFDEFAQNILGAPKGSEVPYLSYQNDSLREQLPELLADIGLGDSGDVLQRTLERYAKSSGPDAVNLWIGDDRSTTTLHKDPYENLYYVLVGTKVFTLFPPTELAGIHEGLYPVARYHCDRGTGGEVVWRVVPVEGVAPTPWVDDAPGGGLKVTVRAGECLYLPSLWYHRVEQRGVTVAVNLWYDMPFDAKWVYYQFLRRVLAGIGPLHSV